jgi:membrane protein implicated in regulation of membrane protease activity
LARAVAGLGTGLQVSKEGLIASLVKLCAIFAIDFQLAALNPKFVWSGFGLAENDLSASPEKLTNSAALIGKSAEVVEEVTELAGYVKVQGETWTARTSSGVRAVGSKVVIEQIDGATLIVG